MSRSQTTSKKGKTSKISSSLRRDIQSRKKSNTVVSMHPAEEYLSASCPSLIQPITLETLFRKLEKISSTKLIPSKKRSVKQFLYSLDHFSTKQDQKEIKKEIKKEDNESEFLCRVNKFWIKEEKFWNQERPILLRQIQTIDEPINFDQDSRPWAYLFNTYLSKHSPSTWFYNCLDPERVMGLCLTLKRFISLEHEKSNTENTSSSLPIIAKAKILLEFLQTHKEDPYSCVVGQQARPAITSVCINYAEPAKSSEDLDLKRHLIELSSLKSDLELARNVRVLSAKLRGVFHSVRPGSIVLVSIPSSDQDINFVIPETVKIDNIAYPVTNTIFDYVSTLDSRLHCEHSKDSNSRSVFARCAMKLTNDNWVALWLGNKEFLHTIVWAPVSSIYIVKDEYKEWLANPKESLSEITSLVVNQFNVLEGEYSAIIRHALLDYIQQYLSISDDVFSSVLRTVVSFVDEEMAVQAFQLIHSKVEDPDLLKDIDILPILLTKKTQFLENIDRDCIFALERGILFKIIENRSTESFFELILQTAKKISDDFALSLEMLEMKRKKIMDGSRKKHITGWWLKETRRTVQIFMRQQGYLYDAVPKDYTNTPPANLALVKSNLELSMAVFDNEDMHAQLLEVIEGLKLRVYPRMNVLVYEFRATIIHQIGQKVTAESIANFDISAVTQQLGELNLDASVLRQIQEMIKDIEYLSMMERLEHHPGERVKHPHIVPLSGLVESSIVRYQSECRTVLELWSNEKTSSTTESVECASDIDSAEELAHKNEKLLSSSGETNEETEKGDKEAKGE